MLFGETSGPIDDANSLPASHQFENQPPLVTARWTIALSRLSLDLLLFKFALAGLVAASLLVLLPGISGRAI